MKKDLDLMKYSQEKSSAVDIFNKLLEDKDLKKDIVSVSGKLTDTYNKKLVKILVDSYMAGYLNGLTDVMNDFI